MPQDQDTRRQDSQRRRDYQKAKQQELDKLKVCLKDCKKERDALAAMDNVRKAQLDKLEACIETLQKRLFELEACYEACGKERNALAAQNQALQQQQQQQLAALKARLNKCMEDLNASRQECDALTAANQGLNAQLCLAEHKRPYKKQKIDAPHSKAFVPARTNSSESARTNSSEPASANSSELDPTPSAESAPAPAHSSAPGGPEEPADPDEPADPEEPAGPEVQSNPSGEGQDRIVQVSGVTPRVFIELSDSGEDKEEDDDPEKEVDIIEISSGEDDDREKKVATIEISSDDDDDDMDDLYS